MPKQGKKLREIRIRVLRLSLHVEDMKEMRRYRFEACQSAGIIHRYRQIRDYDRRLEDRGPWDSGGSKGREEAWLVLHEYGAQNQGQRNHNRGRYEKVAHGVGGSGDEYRRNILNMITRHANLLVSFRVLL